MNVRIKKTDKDAITPTYAYADDGCFDIYSVEDVMVEAGKSKIINTGLIFEIPFGYVMHIYIRSGMGFKHNVRLMNSVGILDSGYRGECKIGLFNHGEHSYIVKKGDRIAQAEINPVNAVTFSIVDELSITDRDDGGFGSTGC